MGIRKVTSFHQDVVKWEKLRSYMRLKEIPRTRGDKGFSMSDMFALLLTPIEQFVDRKGPDPFPTAGKPAPASQEAEEP